MLAWAAQMVEIIHALVQGAMELGFRTWQLVLLIGLFIVAWSWRGAKVPLVSLGRCKWKG